MSQFPAFFFISGLRLIVVQAGTYGNGGAANQKPNNKILETIRVRAAILVNVRPAAGIQVNFVKNIFS